MIDDVIRAAGVSRGTFYKYFDSLEQAVSELGAKHADEMIAAIASVYDVLRDPLERSATGFQLYLSRAVIEPRWGTFVAHVDHLKPDNLLMRYLMGDIKAGAKTGTFNVRSIEAAVDLVIGAMVEGIKRIIDGAASRAYIEAMTGMVLRGLGVAPRVADKAVEMASDRLHREAPDNLTWWRPFS